MPLTTSGIYLPKKIKDATALPEDVSSGKIFYNNDGKQIGSGKIIHTYTITNVGLRICEPINTVGYSNYKIENDSISWYTHSSGGGYTTNAFVLTGILINLGSTILGLKVNDIFFDIPFKRIENYNVSFSIIQNSHEYEILLPATRTHLNSNTDLSVSNIFLCYDGGSTSTPSLPKIEFILLQEE